MVSKKNPSLVKIIRYSGRIITSPLMYDSYYRLEIDSYMYNYFALDRTLRFEGECVKIVVEYKWQRRKKN